MLVNRKRTSRVGSIIHNTVVGFLCLVLAVQVSVVLRAKKVSRLRLEHASDALGKAKVQHNDLSREYEDLTTTDGIEYYVRNHYRALARGEEMVVVVDAAEKKPEKTPQKSNNWSKIMKFLRIPGY